MHNSLIKKVDSSFHGIVNLTVKYVQDDFLQFLLAVTKGGTKIAVASQIGVI